MLEKQNSALIIISVARKSLLDAATEWFAILSGYLRSVFSLPTVEERGAVDPMQTTDPDFDGWLHGDPMVTNNPASRYGDRSPGYITGNGLGSMEIGAADD